MIQAPSARTLLQSIEAMAAEAPEEGFSLRAIMDRLDERAFGALLFVLALPCCIPFLWGVPQVVAVPMIAIAAQMAAGRQEPWLPRRLADRMIDKAGLDRTARGGRRWFGWVEALARPRLLWLSGPKAERLLGLLLCAFCASILVPLPGTNTVPGIGVALVAFGLMARDGLVIVLGGLIGTVWIGLLATVGATVVRAAAEAALGAFGG